MNRYPSVPGVYETISTSSGACSLPYRSFFEDAVRPVEALPPLSNGATLGDVITAYNALLAALRAAGKMKEEV